VGPRADLAVRCLASIACALLLAGCESTAPSEITNGTPAATAPAPPATPASPTVTAIVDLTNQERTRQGLSVLRSEVRLGEAARLQVEQMIRAARLDHVLADAQYPRPEDRLAAAGYTWQAYGENLAFGYPDARSVVQGWMDSPGHRANILGTSFTEIGVATGVDQNGRPYYAQMFGRPR
jgi:uncharacterized protein YkwD